MKPRLTSKDWILLSSYLDDELNPREKARVETRLRSEAAFREALDGLRGTKLLLRRAPARRVPHNFTLPASMAHTKPSPILRLVPALRLSSAVVALVSVFFMASTFLTSSLQMAASPADMAAKEALTMESAPVAPAAEGDAEQSAPPMVYWGGPPAPEVQIGGGAADSGPFAGGMGGGDGGYVPPAVMPTQSAEMFSVQPPTQSFPLATTAPLPEQPVSGTGPILGVAPSEQQGEVLPETNRQLLPMVASGETRGTERSTTLPPLVWTGIGLFIVALGLFVSAWILRRNALR